MEIGLERGKLSGLDFTCSTTVSAAEDNTIPSTTIGKVRMNDQFHYPC